MNDRSRGAATAWPSADAGEAPRETGGRSETGRAWIGRLLRHLYLKSRETLTDDLDAALAEVTTGEHALSPPERTMLKNVLGLHRLRVDDVMVARSEVLAVAADATLGTLFAAFRAAGHSRLPVYGESLDDPRGMVHIRDLMEHVADRLPGLSKTDLSASLASTGLVRPVLFVPPSMPAMDLLVRMQAKHIHMALVIDEHGGTDGLISIEDLVEIVVGDIEDEHDVADGYVVTEEGSLLVDARADLAEVSRASGVDLAGLLDPDADVDTVGGLLVTLAGRVPAPGEQVSAGGLVFEVVEADRRRVKRVRLHRAAAWTASESERADLSAAPPEAGAAGA